MQDYIPNNYFTRSQDLSNTKKKNEAYVGNRETNFKQINNLSNLQLGIKIPYHA